MIDIHAHVTDDLDERLARDSDIGVELTILLATRVHPERARTIAEVRREFRMLQDVVSGDAQVGSFELARSELRSAVEATRGRTAALAAVPLWFPAAEMLEIVDAQLAHPGYVGIGELTPPAGAAATIEPVVRHAADRGGLPVLVHGFAPDTDSDLREYADLARRYPAVPIVVGAFGGLNAMLAVDLACDVPNLHIDMSSALQAFVVAAALREIPGQCMFGSNTPYGVPAASLALVHACTSDAGVLHAVLHDNAAAVFGL